MKDLSKIVKAFAELRHEPAFGVLFTVVSTKGSTYRKAGARMLMLPDERLVGMISGGCLDTDLMLRARQVLDSGLPQKVTYDSTAPDDIVWGLGLGCAGIMSVMLERVDPANPGPMNLLAECLKQRKTGHIKTVVSNRPTQKIPFAARWFRFPDGNVLISKQWSASEDPIPTDDPAENKHPAHLTQYRDMDLLCERIDPPIKLIVFGAGTDAIPLVQFAAQLGWSVEIADYRPGYARGDHFPMADKVSVCAIDEVESRIEIDPWTVIVLMTHHYLNDKLLLPVFLASPAAYVGILGPKKRTEKILDELGEDDFTIDHSMRQRLFGPLGLDIGAEGPEQIALATLAEIVSVLNGSSGCSLREL